MSKNKFRLTKQKNDYLVTKKRNEIKNGNHEVIYNNENKKLDVQDVIKKYNKDIQIKKRFKQFKNKNRKKEYIDFLEEKNNKKLVNGQNLISYNNRYLNDVPYSLSFTKPNHQKNHEEINNLIIEDKYEEFIEKIFYEIITKELFSYPSSKDKSKIIQKVNSNKFIALMMESKKEYQQKIINKEEKESIDYVKLYVAKHLCNRIKKEIRNNKELFECKNQYYQEYKDLTKIKSTLELKNLIEYMYNKFRMNLIDINKVNYFNKKLVNSEQLELLRQNEKLTTKLNTAILHANINLTKNKINGYKLGKINELYSLDIFATNDVLLNFDKNYLYKEKDLLFLNDYRNNIYNIIKDLLLKNTNISKENKEISLDNEEINKILNNIVEIRSFVLHYKKEYNFLEKNKIEKIEPIIQNDKTAYNYAVYEKFLSNSVFLYFEVNEIETILLNSLDLSFPILEENYLPRFSKILDKYLFMNKGYFNNVDISYKNAVTFLLKQIYYTTFRNLVQKENVNSKIFANIFNKYKQKVNTNLEETINVEKLSHLELYKKISFEISSGNYKEFIEIFHIYLGELFIEHLKNKYDFLSPSKWNINKKV